MTSQKESKRSEMHEKYQFSVSKIQKVVRFERKSEQDNNELLNTS